MPSFLSTFLRIDPNYDPVSGLVKLIKLDNTIWKLMSCPLSCVATQSVGIKNSTGNIASNPYTRLNGVVVNAVLYATRYAHSTLCNFCSQSDRLPSTTFVRAAHNVLLVLSAWPLACGCYGADVRCTTINSCSRNSITSLMKWTPWSLTISMGSP